MIEAAILRVKADKGLADRLAILTSIPGVSNLTAFALLIETPELGALEASQAASLAGLAPIARQSARRIGRAFIRGGRPGVRQAFYMPALRQPRPADQAEADGGPGERRRQRAGPDRRPARRRRSHRRQGLRRQRAARGRRQTRRVGEHPVQGQPQRPYPLQQAPLSTAQPRRAVLQQDQTFSSHRHPDTTSSPRTSSPPSNSPQSASGCAVMSLRPTAPAPSPSPAWRPSVGCAAASQRARPRSRTRRLFPS